MTRYKTNNQVICKKNKDDSSSKDLEVVEQDVTRSVLFIGSLGEPRLVRVRAAPVAKHEDWVVILARHEIVLDVSSELFEVALSSQVEPDATRRIDVLERRLAQFSTVKRFEGEVWSEDVDHLLAMMRVQVDEVVIYSNKIMKNRKG